MEVASMSDDVTELPEGVDESERDAWVAWLANGMDEDADAFRDAYAGEWLNAEEYAEDFVNDCYTVPDWVEGYIDYERMARDFELGGDIWIANSDTYTLYVFRN
jgi:antirestriction protein